MPPMHKGSGYALLAAALFGASTPFAKLIGEQVAPVMLAGILYLGSGLGLFLLATLRWLGGKRRPVMLARGDWPWLAGAIAAGGVAGPVLLMFGLTLMPASSASLMLNLEGVLTALLAWFVFKENFDRRIFAGMLLIVAAGVLLSWDRPQAGVPWGALALAGACLCWAVDNNLTRKVSAADPFHIAAVKGLVAGSVNLAIAFGLGQAMPSATWVAAGAGLGFIGYGLSLAMFVLALRHLGTARTGAYFSAAPFIGAAIALLMPGERPGLVFWLALGLMGAGLWLHLTEHHEHEHDHEAMLHDHEHTHDSHHQHEHEPGQEGAEGHAHAHRHRAMRHMHPHYPDIHHRHGH